MFFGDKARVLILFLTSSLLLAIRWRRMIISELRRIIGWFWVAQAKKCILCTMYVRKKHNRSGSTSVVVVSKASGKYKEIKSFGSSTSEEEIHSLCDKAAAWIRSFGGQQELDFDGNHRGQARPESNHYHLTVTGVRLVRRDEGKH